MAHIWKFERKKAVICQNIRRRKQKFAAVNTHRSTSVIKNTSSSTCPLSSYLINARVGYGSRLGPLEKNYVEITETLKDHEIHAPYMYVKKPR